MIKVLTRKQYAAKQKSDRVPFVISDPKLRARHFEEVMFAHDNVRETLLAHGPKRAVLSWYVATRNLVECVELERPDLIPMGDLLCPEWEAVRALSMDPAEQAKTRREQAKRRKAKEISPTRKGKKYNTAEGENDSHRKDPRRTKRRAGATPARRPVAR